ncbi:MAG: dihydroorotate dehydrogenase electron transfer subunit, partial [Phycisphaerales bacterium]|nr:dihydroorotate dehydrogenase electron transfer subunit [Phycisphaerales bacterium]
MSVVARNQFVSTVAANVPLCAEHYRLVLSLPEFPATEPGQFIQIACRDLAQDEAGEHDCEVEWQPGRTIEICAADLASPAALLRRPFSLAGRRNVTGGAGGRAGGGVELDIIHRVVGVGTDWLSRLTVGDHVGILGPLGNTFRLPMSQQTAVLVGGGVGIPPMLYLAEKLANGPAVAFCGALRRDLLPLTITADADRAGNPSFCIDEFSRHGILSVITTDDGSYGFRGFVTQALERYLDSLGPHSSPLSPVIYTCGPELMMKRVADIAAARGIECQIAVERAMACGMGTCQSCCIKVRKPDPSKPP